MARAPPRARPMVSISSMKMIAGATFRASPNSSRTRLAPTPTIISMNSEALALKNGTLASPAVARASSVFPVPGGPESSTPLGARAPRRRYFSGSLRKSTTSLISASTSSMPATSSKVTRTVSGSTRFCLPPSSPPESALCWRLNIQIQNATSRIMGANEISRLARKPRCWTSGVARTVAPLLVSSPSRSSLAKVGRSVVNCL